MRPALKTYQDKRDFARTPEPRPETARQASAALPRFVIQKHLASHLHYDFRLEVEGVLKSWAVPKGPSLDPGDKKLAMQVEDHPFDYRNFEGIIPEGNYGAGTVMIWDEGTYEVPSSSQRDDIEKTMRRDLAKGHLRIILHGQKLNGEFSLVRMKKEERSWLLVKKEDTYSSIDDVLTHDSSARTGRSMDEIRTERTAEWQSNRPKGQGSPFATESRSATTAPENKQAAPAVTKKKKSTGPAISGALAELLQGARRGPMPTAAEPMLATLTEAAFDRRGWVFEIKWDGFRAFAETHRGTARLYSRHNLDYSDEFVPIAQDLKKVPFEAVLDGEIVVVDKNGKSSFKLLQQYRQTGKGVLLYYVFDLLYFEGYDLRTLPLERRKALLKEIIPAGTRLKYSDHIEEHGVQLYKQALSFDVEGIIAKSKTSQYRTGVRSSEWLKIKAHHRQEAVIGGFTEPRGGRHNLGALLLGVYEGKDLVYVGHTGGGFDEKTLQTVREKIEPLIRKTSPFKTKPKTNAPATWVEPRLVCEVRFADWTHDGLMRQPIFLGMREDKEAGQVRRERPVTIVQALAPKRFVPHDEQKQTLQVGERELEISNPHKVFWADEGITKSDVIRYYRAIARWILPHLIDRPESLHRFPNGIQGKGFFQKDYNESAPDWIQQYRVESEAEGHAINYVLCQDEPTLVYLVNLGAIELNPWLSRVPHLDHPDVILIDLDPEGCTFQEVVRVAGQVHEILEDIAVPNFVKTSGQTGLHICIPTGGVYTYAQTRQFAHLVARLTNEILPDMTSLERSPEKRQGKIYLDYLQNRLGQTMAAPYTIRPRAGAPVSAPLRWDELSTNLSPDTFNLHTMPERLARVGDLWHNVLGPGLDMPRALTSLKKSWTELRAVHA